MGLDFKVLMQSPEVHGARGGGVESAIGKLVGAAMPAALRAASGCAAAAGVDLVVCSCTFPGGPDLAEAHGAALVTAALAPVFPTRSFPFFLASAVAPLRFLNRATYMMPAMARTMHGSALAARGAAAAGARADDAGDGLPHRRQRRAAHVLRVADGDCAARRLGRQDVHDRVLAAG